MKGAVMVRKRGGGGGREGRQSDRVTGSGRVAWNGGRESVRGAGDFAIVGMPVGTSPCVSCQVICGPDALATLWAQLDVPAEGQQDGQGHLHARRAEQRPIFLINGHNAAIPAVVGYRLPLMLHGPLQRQASRLQLDCSCVSWGINTGVMANV